MKHTQFVTKVNNEVLISEEALPLLLNKTKEEIDKQLLVNDWKLTSQLDENGNCCHYINYEQVMNKYQLSLPKNVDSNNVSSLEV